LDRFYDDAESLFVEAYDAFYDQAPPQIAGDAAFYAKVARATGGPVLELACGTGRVALALAREGLDVTGVDLSEAMLSVARHRAAALPGEAQRRLSLIQGDMTGFTLERRFGFVFVAFRSFQHLLSTDLQGRALEAIRRHLEPASRLALHLFDPRLDLLTGESPLPITMAGTHATTGRHYRAEVLRTRLDHLAQVRRDLWRYQELGPDGQALREETREMALRWTYRWELHYLLTLFGFSVEAEYSDFTRSPPAYGKELIVVAQPA